MKARAFSFQSVQRLRALLLLPLIVLSVIASRPEQSRATAFSKNNFAVGGDPKTAAYPNATSDFFRWEQSIITYAFTPQFNAFYGLPGQARVTTAFGTWVTGGTALSPLDQSAAFNPLLDIKIRGQANTFDFQSVALHEIGHAIGFDHPDIDPNFNVVAGDWVAGALPVGSHPIMFSTIAPNITRQVLTRDDVRASEFLYSMVAPGAGAGPAGGPVFGNGARNLAFANIAFNPLALPDILITAGPTTALAETFRRPGGAFQAVPLFTYTRATNASFLTIKFAIPEPGTLTLAIFGGGGFMAVVFRRSQPRNRG